VLLVFDIEVMRSKSQRSRSRPDQIWSESNASTTSCRVPSSLMCILWCYGRFRRRQKTRLSIQKSIRAFSQAGYVTRQWQLKHCEASWWSCEGFRIQSFCEVPCRAKRFTAV